MTWIAAPFGAYRVGLPAARRVVLSELAGEHVVAQVRLDFHNPAFGRPAAAVEAAQPIVGHEHVLGGLEFFLNLGEEDLEAPSRHARTYCGVDWERDAPTPLTSRQRILRPRVRVGHRQL